MIVRAGHCLLLALVLLGVSACSSSDEDDPRVLDDGAMVRYSLDADPNGIWWDDAEQRLYVTDNERNGIHVFDEEGGLVPYADFSDAPDSGADVSQLVRGDDGSFWAPRFGFGSDGTLLQVRPDGTSTAYTELDPQRRRIGLTQSGAGEWLVSWFVRGGTGGVSRLIPDTAAGTAVEIDLVVGFYKPTGIAVVDRTLYVNDQGPGELRSFDLDALLNAPTTADAGSILAQFSDEESTDLMVSDGSQSLYFGSRAGNLFSVDLEGTVVLLAEGLNQVRGVALDRQGQRLLAVDHSPDPDIDGPHGIVILPLPTE